MKIVKVEILHLRVPFKKPYITADHGEGRECEEILVLVHTDEGIIGLGETETYSMFGYSVDMTISALKNVIAPAIIGMDPTNIEAINAKMDQVLRWAHPIKCPIDIACWDILGKAMNKPIYELLGGKKREYGESSWPIGATSPEAAREEALWAKEQGYTMVGVKAGSTPDYRDDLKRVAAVRDACGPDFNFMTDYNTTASFERSLNYAHGLEEYTPALFEQPFPYWDVDTMAKLKGMINIPLSTDEGVYSVWSALQYCEKKAADVVSIKPYKEGGITGSWKVINAVAPYGVKHYTNTMFELGIMQSAGFHMTLASPCLYDYRNIGHSLSSPLRMKEDVTDYAEQFKNGKVYPNGKPGLGVILNMEIIKKYQDGDPIIIL